MRNFDIVNDLGFEIPKMTSQNLSAVNLNDIADPSFPSSFLPIEKELLPKQLATTGYSTWVNVKVNNGLAQKISPSGFHENKAELVNSGKSIWPSV